MPAHADSRYAHIRMPHGCIKCHTNLVLTGVHSFQQPMTSTTTRLLLFRTVGRNGGGEQILNLNGQHWMSKCVCLGALRGMPVGKYNV